MSDRGPSVMHLEAPFKISATGFYVNTACGAYILGPAAMSTTDPEKVTCRSCKRTRAIRYTVMDDILNREAGR